MALTMPRQYPFPAPPGEYRAECAYCGMTWYRSSLIRDAAGLLACPDDQEGRDTVTLDRLGREAANAAIAEANRIRRERW